MTAANEHTQRYVAQEAKTQLAEANMTIKKLEREVAYLERELSIFVQDDDSA
jgi:hypothetical protein